jgi:hypothetical protein
MYGKHGQRTVIAFYVSAAISGVLMYARTSEAFWTRQDANYCNVALGGNDFFRDGCNITTAGSIVVSCPVADSSTHPKTSITTFNVHVDDESPSFSIISRCVDFWNVVGGSCGSSVITSNGVLGWSPPSFAGWDAPNFGFISVVLPPRAAANTCLQGYFTAG